MAFMKITNGSAIFEVQTGAFNTIYKGLGFVECDENSDVSNDLEPTNDELPDDTKVDDIPADGVTPVMTKSSDEAFVVAMLEKPIAGWNKEEIVRFTTIKAINISGTKNASEAKEIIKQFNAVQK